MEAATQNTEEKKTKTHTSLNRLKILHESISTVILLHQYKLLLILWVSQQFHRRPYLRKIKIKKAIISFCWKNQLE